MQAIIVSFHVLATSNGPDDDSMTLLMDHSTKHPTILGNPEKNSAVLVLYTTTHIIYQSSI
jgi:hypothetical protein